MAHFAQLNEQNNVTRVIVVDNQELLEQGEEREIKGVAFCQSLLGGTWKQTSYHGTIRKNYAATGDTYDSQRDAFISPKPYPSWIFNEDTCKWDAPTPYPMGGNKLYKWDEATLTWIETRIESE